MPLHTIIDHLLCSGILLTLILGEKHGLGITWKIIISLFVISGSAVSDGSVYRYGTIETGCWNSEKGYHLCICSLIDHK